MHVSIMCDVCGDVIVSGGCGGGVHLLLCVDLLSYKNIEAFTS